MLASSIPSSSAFFYPYNRPVQSDLRCCKPNPWSKPFDQNFIKFDESFQSGKSSHFTNSFDDSILNRAHLLRRNQTVTGFTPALPPIPSVDSDSNFPVESPVDSQQRLRHNSSLDSHRYHVSLYSSQSYFNENLEKYLFKTSPSVEDNNRFKNEWQTKSYGRERTYSREYLSLDLRDESDKSFRQRTSELYQKEVRRRRTVDSEESVCTIVEGVKSELSFSPKKTFKDQLEGKVVAPKLSKCLEKEKSDNEKEQNSVVGKVSNQKLKQNLFQKCQSRSSATSSEAVSTVVTPDDDINDDVFDSPNLKVKSKPSNVSKKKILQSKAKQNKSSNNLETSPTRKANKSVESKSRNSSVTIKDRPEYLAGITSTKSSKIASSDTIAKLHTKPSRGSLKKSTNNNSDYDRDRGRSRHMEGGHRESFKKNDRTNERGSDQDRDSSDREHKDGSLNRSLSNTDTNLEDRIGKKQLS